MPNLKNKKVIKDQQGQRKYPGRVTEIQGDTMATTGYGDIPLYVVPNVGNPMVVPANSGNRVFPGASSFTEYPIAKNGGWLEKYQVGGKKQPIYTNDPNDPRLKAYADSLYMHNYGNKEAALLLNPETTLKNWDDWHRQASNYRIKDDPNRGTTMNAVLDPAEQASRRLALYNYNKKKSSNDNVEYPNRSITDKEKHKTYFNYLETGNKTRSFDDGWFSDLLGNTDIGTAHLYAKPVQPYILKPEPLQSKPKPEILKPKPKPKPIEKKKIEVITPKDIPIIKANVPDIISQQPIKTKSVNILNPTDEYRREVNFGQKYQTYVYKGEKNPRYKDPTTGNDIDVSKSFDLKGNYNPVYLEQKKYGGWLEQYGDGGETDPPGGLKNNQWMGANLNKEGYITSETKGGNRISFTGDQKADELFNKQIDSGKFGFDPKTGVTFLLKKSVNGLNEKDKFIGSETYSDLQTSEGFTNKSQKEQISKLPDFQKNIINAENEQRRKDYVRDDMKKAYQNPLMYAPGIIGAAPFAVAGLAEAGMASAPYIQGALSTQLPGMANVSGATVGNAITAGFAGHGAAHITPDAIEMYKNPSWSNAGNLAMDVAEVSPLIGPTSKVIGKGLNAAGKYLTEETALKNAYKLNPLANKEVPLNKLYHKTNNPNLSLDEIDLLRLGKSQSKKRHLSMLESERPSGFYTSDEAFYPFMGGKSKFSFDFPANAKIKDLKLEGRITDRISQNELKELQKEGYDLIRGENMIGQTEYIPLNKSKISNWNFEGTAGESNVIPGAADQSVFNHLKKLKDQRFETANSHWLKGYPKVTKQLPGSPNAVSSVDDVAINLESQIANLKQQEVLAEKSRKALWADYKAGKISGEDYTIGAKKLNPGLEGTNPRFELEKQLRQHNVKQDIINTPQQNILKSENQLGKNISDGGTNNKGVFELGDDYVARLSAHGYDDASRLVNYADKIKSPRIAKTLQVKEIDGKVYQVQNKVTGTPIPKLSETELQNIPKEHIDNFWKDKAELDNLGLSIDISGGKSNIFYDPKKGFQFIDLGIVSKDGQNMMESNEVFAQTYKGLKLPGSSNAVSSSEDVVQQLRNELSEKGIISQQKTLNLPWKEPIRKGVEPWGYGNDNASLLPITGSKFKDVKGAIVGGKNPSYLSDKEYLMKSGNYDAKLRKANDLLIKEGKDPVYDDDMKELLKNKPVLSNEKNIKDAINLRDKIKYTYEESKYRISPDNTYLNESFTKNQRNRYATWDMYLGKPQKEHSMYDISELTKSKKDVIYTIKEDFMNKHAIQRKFDSFFKDIDNEKFAGSKIESSWKQKDNSFIIPDTDNNMFGTMGGFHWKLEKMADGNFKAIANDVWDLQPFKNSKLPKVIRNLEVGKTLGIGKPLNVKVGFILDGKTKKIIKTFGLGGTVLQTAASQNKQDNSQWLNKYK